MAQERERHAAALLPDGRVLVAGGYSDSDVSALSTCEIYNPAANAWTQTGSLSGGTYGRAGFTLTALADGKFLAASGWEVETMGGGYNQVERRSAELYDPSTGTWSVAGFMDQVCPCPLFAFELPAATASFATVPMAAPPPHRLRCCRVVSKASLPLYSRTGVC